MMKRMLSAKFDFEDFLKQYKSINKMGTLGSVMKMIPGMNKMDDKTLQNVERKYAMYETIIKACFFYSSPRHTISCPMDI
jgi:signal recognition particle subunit SRP54